MAINANDLKNLLIDAIQEKDTAIKCNTAVADTIRNYLNSNLEVQGTYFGLTPATPPAPDPANGVYKWKVIGCTLNGAGLLAAAQTNTFEAQIGFAIMGMLSIPLDTTSKVTSSPIAITGLTIVNNRTGVENFRDAMGNLAIGIVNGIKSAVPVGGDPASSTQGAGKVTPIAFL